MVLGPNLETSTFVLSNLSRIEPEEHSFGQSIAESEQMIELEKRHFGSLIAELRETLLISHDLIITFFLFGSPKDKFFTP